MTDLVDWYLIFQYGGIPCLSSSSMSCIVFQVGQWMSLWPIWNLSISGKASSTSHRMNIISRDCSLLTLMGMRWMTWHWSKEGIMTQILVSRLRYIGGFLSSLWVSTILINWSFWNWNIIELLGQYHGCWCPGSLCHQAISNHVIDYAEAAEQTGLFHPQRRISTISAI